jgi:hypothetical protein
MDKPPSLDQIAADGNPAPEPSQAYLQCLEALDNAVRECIHVSRQYAGIRSPTAKHFYASVLFTQLLNKSVTLLVFSPLSPWAEKVVEHWDYASLTGVVRSMIETRLTFHYLCADPCSPDEWDCRWNLLNLHDCTARIRLFQAKEEMTGAAIADIASLEAQAEELRGRLNSNAFFVALPEKQQRKFLRGRDSHLYPLEELAERAAVGRGTFKFLHILFSQHVHGLPMSFYRIGGDYPERGRGLPSEIEENYTTLCLSFALTLLVGARDEMHTLFAGYQTEGAKVGSTPKAPSSSPNQKRLRNLFLLAALVVAGVIFVIWMI